ncbi:pyridoxamine 5'-phosphate oxidase family protein [Microbulbifer sp. OS29]|uniref:Pyridoxamine 5'-phosphate oxidase family protein n=1 Tax=Microbulbifer okhotskensis TaxID=2926617 RepID=A0A9X2EQR5_9GAMM|nr:pyridoxamine 5'-phosphate oxidase family protein [Microbulbifer okhotskensis]MCO1336724.1 pyridoxamine 5'-phosphate oxidase family protein [Microbulbifer okhotskensis]
MDRVHSVSGELPTSEKSRVRRGAKRASYRREEIYPLIDELKLGHVGFSENGEAIIIPLTVWRLGCFLYFHVANKSRLQKLIEAGGQVCISFARYDEWVLSKSAFHHSANYRSAVLFCRGERVCGQEEFDAVFKAIINDIEPDRWEQVRAPNLQERKGTALIRLTIEEGAFKSRTGGPSENKEDLTLPVWSGIKPAL